LYLSRTSYFYHEFQTSFQKAVDRRNIADTSRASSGWGSGAFTVSAEPTLTIRYRDTLDRLRKVLPMYVEQVVGLKAIAAARGIPVVYALQPELMTEPSGRLVPEDQERQQLAFRHHHELGTLEWRHLTAELRSKLAQLSGPGFQFIDLSSIAGDLRGEALYTDYCHLTPAGNRIVAQRLALSVADLLHAPRLTAFHLPDRRQTIP
jgi:hypothetical protein